MCYLHATCEADDYLVSKLVKILGLLSGFIMTLMYTLDDTCDHVQKKLLNRNKIQWKVQHNFHIVVKAF